MTLKEAIERYTNNAKYERIHGSLQGSLDFIQLAEWLKDYKRLLEQEPKWISVSERLPEENKQVLIQYRTRYRDDVYLFDVTSRVDYNYWQGMGREIDAIAWMPLPKPYKAESEDKE